MSHHRQKNIPFNPTTLEEIQGFLDSELVKSSTMTPEATYTFHSITIVDQFAFAIFKSDIIVKQLPADRFFNITSTMNVLTNGIFKVFLTLSVVKDTQVRILLKQQEKF